MGFHRRATSESLELSGKGQRFAPLYAEPDLDLIALRSELEEMFDGRVEIAELRTLDIWAFSPQC